MSANFFTNPPKAGTAADYTANPSYPLNSNLTVSWQAPQLGPPFDLLLIQDVPGSASHSYNYYKVIENYNESSIDLSVTPSGLYLNTSKYENVFYFAIYQTGTSHRVTSHYFNITKALSSTPATSTTTTFSIGEASVPTDIPSASPTTTSVQQGDSGTSSELSTGAKAGIGVGVLVAFLIIIGLIVWVLRRHQYTQRVPAGATPEPMQIPPSHEPKAQGLHEAPNSSIKFGTEPPSELHGHMRTPELP